MALEVTASVLDGIRGYGEKHRSAGLEIGVSVSQLREMPAAERSLEAAQKDKDHRPAAEAGQRHLGPIVRQKREVWGRRPYGHGIAGEGHCTAILPPGRRHGNLGRPANRELAGR